MALNPDDLLIFKVREGDNNEPTEKKAKKQPRPEQQPAMEAAKPAPMPMPPSQPQTQPPRSEAQQQSMSEPAQINIQPNPDYLSRDYIEHDGNMPSPDEMAETAMNVSMGKRLERKHMKKEANPRKIAEHMSCELHPWRRAYSICSYCKRAFCYEDILESGGKYYCLDDIDKVPEAEKAQAIRYNNLSLLSSVLFMLVFLIFIYYSYSSVLLLLDAMTKGMVFLSVTTTQELILMGEIVVTVVSLIAAIAILLNADSSFKISAIAGLFTVGLFSFQYLNNNQTFMLGVAVCSFIALVTLAYSRVSYDSLAEGDHMYDRESGTGFNSSGF